MTVAAIYARVSTTDQDCEMQLTELRRYAGAQGFTIKEEYVDAGFSGKHTKRPAFQRCIKDALKHKFDVLLVWKLDRFGRSVSQITTDIPRIADAGVRFICPSQGIDTIQTNPFAKAMLQLMAVFAELERSLIAERVSAGVRQYRDDYDAGKIGKTKHSKSGKDLAPHRPRRIFNRDRIREMRAAGKSWNEIVAETGLPKTTVRRAMENV